MIRRLNSVIAGGMALGLAAGLAVAPLNAEAQRLGRLFSTPEERALLDELRRERHLVSPEPQSLVEVAPEIPNLEQVTIDGVVLRSSGANSAWINGRHVTGGDTTREGVRVDTSPAGGGRVKITLPSGVETIDLKPGQKIDVNSGVVVEAYERGSGPRGLTVFDRVSRSDIVVPESDSTENLDENAPAQTTQTPAIPQGGEYPEALLERIRRALQGN